MRPNQRPDADSGMSTVETAIAFPVLVLALLAVLAAMQVATLQSRTCDVARVAARAAAIGGSAAGAGAHLPQAHVAVAMGGEWIDVQVRAPVSGPLGVTGLQVKCGARAMPEPGTA